MNAPCKDCPDRHEGCHGKCERYAAYRAKMDEQCRERCILRDAIDARSETYYKSHREKLNRKKGRC